MNKTTLISVTYVAASYEVENGFARKFWLTSCYPELFSSNIFIFRPPALITTLVTFNDTRFSANYLYSIYIHTHFPVKDPFVVEVS